MTAVLDPPFPYFGGKRRAAALIWSELGDPTLYIEPFGGSLAVLLARLHEPRAEVAVDVDGLLVNFWRAVKYAPHELLAMDSGPVAETDISAWHHELIAQRPTLTEALRRNSPVFDITAAHRWWAGASAWIGRGWCVGGATRQRPHIDRTLKGLYAARMTDERLHAIAARLANVVLLADDWTRAVSDSTLNRFRHDRGGVGVFLDPPYTHATGRERDLYAHDAPRSAEVEAWAVHASAMRWVRIVIAGYEGEYPVLEQTWRIRRWMPPNGYAREGNSRRHDEVLLFSPRRRIISRMRK